MKGGICLRRLKKEIRDKVCNKKEPFEISVSKTFPKLLWQECHWCDYEFRRGEGTLIVLIDNQNPIRNDKGYALCSKCTNGIDTVMMERIWVESKEFKEFKTEEFKSYLELGDY